MLKKETSRSEQLSAAKALHDLWTRQPFVHAVYL